mgnify:CR=1 FL=1
MCRFVFKKYREIANELLVWRILYAAASGKGIQRGNGFADILVINNNRTKGDVRMYDIGTLINKIITQTK